MAKLRCVSLNLKGLVSGWYRERGRRVIGGLRELSPDLVFLQESTIRHGTPIQNQALEIGEAVGLPYSAFGSYSNPIEVMSAEHGGIAILSRWPFRHVRNRKLPPGHDHPPDARVALIACIDAPGGLLQVINTHLSWKPDEAPMRLVQMGLLLEDLNEDQCLAGRARLILAGDLNALEDEPCVQLASENLIDAFRASHPEDPGYTWVRENPMASHREDNPDRRLDYIFVSRTARVLRCDVVLDSRSVPVSDHFGVLAELEWPEAA
jgi:endonuclease/exonuclease/phosphatase family metal-dependent hydrolase